MNSVLEVTPIHIAIFTITLILIIDNMPVTRSQQQKKNVRSEARRLVPVVEIPVRTTKRDLRRAAENEGAWGRIKEAVQNDPLPGLVDRI
ncbi:hypothetical protein NMY22_g482 [Coprinellus aureogranulatus]|nr:hypothetical protein NMY22_g482 [Coprinellus aureogranulatus]